MDAEVELNGVTKEEAEEAVVLRPQKDFKSEGEEYRRFEQSGKKRPAGWTIVIVVKPGKSPTAPSGD